MKFFGKKEEKTELRTNSDFGQPSEPDSPNKKDSRMFSNLRCPKCDSTSIRTKNFPLLVTVFACVLFCLAFSVSIIHEVSWLIDVLMTVLLIGANALIPFAFFAMISFALVGRYRCKDCGYRFRTGINIEQGKSHFRFRIEYSIISILILFLGLVVIPETIIRTTDSISDETIGFLRRIVQPLVFWSFISGLCVLYQAIIYRLLWKKIGNSLAWAILFLLPAVVLSPILIPGSLPKPRAQMFLPSGGYARLPGSATGIRACRWRRSDENVTYIMFSATDKDIEQFLDTSPLLQSIQMVRYSNGPRIKNFVSKFPTPDWYAQNISGQGRYYYAGDKRLSSEVIVNDEKNIIYIRINW
jgi:hypothetical protein